MSLPSRRISAGFTSFLSYEYSSMMSRDENVIRLIFIDLCSPLMAQPSIAEGVFESNTGSVCSDCNLQVTPRWEIRLHSDSPLQNMWEIDSLNAKMKQNLGLSA